MKLPQRAESTRRECLQRQTLAIKSKPNPGRRAAHLSDMDHDPRAKLADKDTQTVTHTLRIKRFPTNSSVGWGGTRVCTYTESSHTSVETTVEKMKNKTQQW